MTFSLGDIRVDEIEDIETMDMTLAMVMPGVHPDELLPYLDWIEPDHYTAATATLHLTCRSFLLRHAGRVVLVDTCVGCGKARSARPAWDKRTDDRFLRNLRAAGVAPEQVDTVFCTHLHVDHVGWNTQRVDGRWVPTFPNARYLIGRSEMAHWEMQARLKGAETIAHGAFVDSVLPIVAAGQAELVDDGYQLADGLALCALAGHTPGQLGLRIDRGSTRALFCGDAMHSPVQIPHPEWATAFCTDAPTSVATRHAMFAEAVSSGRVIIPAHLRRTASFRVSEVAGAFHPTLF